MKAATTLRTVLMVSAASLALVACNGDGDGGGGGGGAPTPPPPPPTPTGPTQIDLSAGVVCEDVNIGTFDNDGEIIEVNLRTSDLVSINADLEVQTCEFPGDEFGGRVPDDAVFPRLEGDNGVVPILFRGVTSVGSDSGRNDDDAVLTIEAGATIVGASGPDVIVVTRGSQIIANGSPDNPIIFTSLDDVALAANGEARGFDDPTRGEWGGIVINGQAPINDCDGGFIDNPEDPSSDPDNCIKDGEGNSGFFGGSDPMDSSGVIRWAQLRYAGFRFNPENELNGIAFQGVGRGLSTAATAALDGVPAFRGSGPQPYEFIQIHNNADDGLEWFGGTANARYLVLTGNDDDSLDWTDGWKGNVQYALIQQTNGGGNNGFEGDNRSNDEDVLPRSTPTISNVTFVGDPAGDNGAALRLREGTGGLIANSVFVNLTDGDASTDDCLQVDAEQNDVAVVGEDLLATNTLNLESVLFDCDVDFVDDDDADGENESEILFNADSPFFFEAIIEEVDGEDAITGVGPARNTNRIGANTLADTFFPGPAETPVGPDGLSDALDLTLVGDTFDNRTGQDDDDPSNDLPGRTGVSQAFIDADNGFDREFFDSVDFIGAFDPALDVPGATFADNWAAGWTFGVLEGSGAAGDCPTGTVQTAETLTDLDGVDKTVCRLQGAITSDVTLTAGNLYQLNGVVSVGEDAAPVSAGGLGMDAQTATLTIEPGVTVFGVNGPDVLVVARGSRLVADGTAAAPIVFTSDEDLAGGNAPDARGQFGGVVVNGLAPINDCDGGFVDNPEDPAADQGNCIKDGEGNSGFFGGADPADDSGVLRYVQVRFAGFRFNPQNELNGVALQGAGTGTTLEFIQIHNNADDGIEFFGGTVNARGLVLTGNDDDSLDWTDGWVGNVQYVIIEQGNDGGDHGFEADNRSNDENVLPRSNPTISNVTIIGDGVDTDSALRLREGTGARLRNFLIAGQSSASIHVDDEQDDAAVVGDDLLASGVLSLDSVFIEGTPGQGIADVSDGDSDGDTAEEVALVGANFAIDASTLGGFSFYNNGVGVIPLAGGAEAGVTAATGLGDFFDDTTFVGAVAPGTVVATDGTTDFAGDWFSAWTFVDPNATR